MGKYGFSVWMGGLPERVRTRDIEDFFKGFGKIIDISMKTKYAFVEFEDERDAGDACKELDDTKMNGSRIKLEMSKGCKDKYRDFQRTGRVRYRSFSREVSAGKRRYRSRSKGGSRSRSRSPRGRGGGRDDRRGGGRDNRGGGRDFGGRGGRERPGSGGGGRETFYNKPAYRKYGAPAKTKYSVEVENLSSRCSWQDLKDFMRKAGEVTYGEAHGQLGKNRGVVCYEREEEMQRAVDELDGREINGRAVKLTDKVREDWDTGEKRETFRSRSRSPPPRRSRSRSRSASPRKRRSRSDSRSKSRGGSRDRKASRSASRGRKSGSPRSKSRTPERKESKDRKRSRSGSRRRSRSR